MENRRIINYILILTLAATLSPIFVFAYSEKTTHPALADESVDLFNYYYPELKLTENEKNLIKKGSTEEDEAPRWMNHFYDPVHNEGLTGFLSSKNWASNTMVQGGINDQMVGSLAVEYFSGAFDYSWDRAVYDYLYGDKNRAFIALGHVIHLIEDATVPDHTRNDMHPPIKDLESPYEGWVSQFNDSNFNLAQKLIQEKAPPIIYGSLNEYFDDLAVYSNNNFFSKDTILDEKFAQPVIEFRQEKLLSDGNKYIFGYKKDSSQNTFKLVLIKENRWSDTEYSISDPDNLILSDYWSLLSRKAVLGGTGVIKLFFDDVAKERQTMALFEKNQPFLASAFFSIKNFVTNSAIAVKNFTIKVAITVKDVTVSSAQAIAEATKNAINKINFLFSVDSSSQIANVSSQTSDITSQLTVSAPSPESPATAPTQPATPNQSANADATGQAVVSYSSTADLLQQLASAQAQLDTLRASIPAQPPTPNPTQTPSPTPGVDSQISFVFAPYGGFGGGGPSPSGNDQLSISNEQTNNNNQNENNQTATTTATTTPEVSATPADVLAPSAPVITSPSDFSAQFSTTTIIFSGTAEAPNQSADADATGQASSTIFVAYLLNDATTTATTTIDNSGAWSISLNFNQGTTTVNFYATDEANNTSSTTVVELFVDSITPDVTLAIAECENSISSDFSDEFCFTPALTAHASWSSTDPNIDYYEVTPRYGLWFATTTEMATTTDAIFSDEYDLKDNIYFSVRAKDKAGNWSATTTQEIAVHKMPVVINEIAWAGTKASSNDEWIELYNNTSFAINLNNFILRSQTDNSPNISLSGTIPANGYFLLERTASTTVSDIQEDMIYTGALSNSGEILVLEYALPNTATTTVDQTILLGNGNWPAGENDENKHTMERKYADESGTYTENWKTSNAWYNGLDADGNELRGTPKELNGASHPPAMW